MRYSNGFKKICILTYLVAWHRRQYPYKGDESLLANGRQQINWSLLSREQRIVLEASMTWGIMTHPYPDFHEGLIDEHVLISRLPRTVYPKKYAHGFLLCCALLWLYIDWFSHIYISLTSLALWQSNDCPSTSKATLINMDKYFMWIHYERLHNHNKAKYNKTVCIFLEIYCMFKQQTCSNLP